MKTLFAFLICSCSTYYLFSQNIIGQWQINSPLSKNFEACYYFNEDGTFSYQPDSYNTLQIVSALNGRYKVTSDSLHLTITDIEIKSVDLNSLKITRNIHYSKERHWVKDGFDNVDGILRDFPSTSNGWSVSCFQRKTIPVSPQEYVVPFEYFEDDEMHLILDGHKFNYKYIRIDGDSFYYIYGPSDIKD